MKLHPAPLPATWRGAWELSHGKMSTLLEGESANFWSKILCLYMGYEWATAQQTPNLVSGLGGVNLNIISEAGGVSIFSSLWFALNYAMDEQTSNKWISTDNVFLSNLFHMCLKAVQDVQVQNLCGRKKRALLNSHINCSTDLQMEWNWKVSQFHDNRHFINISVWSLLNDNRPSFMAGYKLSFGKAAYPNAAIYIYVMNIHIKKML